jgi:hypothetical protein
VTTYDAVAAVVAAGLVGLVCALRRSRAGVRGPHGRAARFVLWLGIAAPLPFLLVPPSDRFRLFVRGAGGIFEGFQLLAFAAAAAALVLTLLPRFRSWWANALVVAAASTVALAASVLRVRQ